MAASDDLGGQLYAHLAGLIAPADSLSAFPSCLVLLEPVGKVLGSLADLADSERSEVVAAFVNSVPAAAPTFLDSGRYYDDEWSFVIHSARPTGPVDEPAATTVTSLVADSLSDFALMERASLSEPGLTYHPVQATPSDWLAGDGWARIEIQLGGDDPSPVPVPPDKVIIPDQLPPLTWTMENDHLVAEAAHRTDISTRDMIAQVGATLERHQSWRPPLVEQWPVELPTVPVVPHVDPPPLRVDTDLLAQRALQVVSDDRSRAAVMGLRRDVAAADDLHLSWRHAWSSTRAADLISAESNATPTASGFRLSFEYRLVGIRRPWLRSQLFSLSGWTVPGLAQPISDGKPLRNTGSMPLLTTRMLVVRDLHVQASWSAADKARAEAEDSISFGPFSVAGSKGLDGSDLRQPAAQVVAWLAVVVPPCPPA